MSIQLVNESELRKLLPQVNITGYFLNQCAGIEVVLNAAPYEMKLVERQNAQYSLSRNLKSNSLYVTVCRIAQESLPISQVNRQVNYKVPVGKVILFEHSQIEIPPWVQREISRIRKQITGNKDFLKSEKKTLARVEAKRELEWLFRRCGTKYKLTQDETIVALHEALLETEAELVVKA